MSKSERITAPSDPAEAAEHAADLAILNADPRTADSANRPAWLVARVLREAREAAEDRRLTVARRQLPAIAVQILSSVPITPGMRRGETFAVCVTIPRADAVTYAIAYRVASDACAVLGIHGSCNGSLAQVALPEIAAGRQNTCVTVTMQCHTAHEAAELVTYVHDAAIAASHLGFGGAQTHRVVRK